MNRSLLSLTLIASTAFASSAFAQSAIITSHMQRPPVNANVLGPKSTDYTVAEAVARSQAPSAGYSVRDLVRTADGGWQGLALDRNSKPVVVALDSQGKVSEVR